jgi:hypothetical protein
VERRLGAGTIGLVGHIEASPPKRGEELEPYLASGISPDQYYTVVHFHGWLTALATGDVAREEFVRAISGSADEPRRIAFRERHHEAQTLPESFGNYIGYSIKNEHSVSSDAEFGDRNLRYAIARFRKYLRGNGLKGTRVRFGTAAILRSLDAYWKRNRSTIYASVVRLEQTGSRPSAPENLLKDYLHWKQAEECSVSKKSVRKNFSYSTLIYNWLFASLAVLRGYSDIHVHATRFRLRMIRLVGYRSRAPPWGGKMVS